MFPSQDAVRKAEERDAARMELGNGLPSASQNGPGRPRSLCARSRIKAHSETRSPGPVVGRKVAIILATRTCAFLASMEGTPAWTRA